jgi:hypothetical protein
MRRWVIGGVALALIAAAIVWLLVGRDKPRAATRGAPPGISVGASAVRRGAGSIAGTVRDANAVTIAGATVCIDGGADASQCTSTNAQGAYVIGELSPGAYGVTASAPHFKPSHYRTGKDQRITSVTVAPAERRTGIDVVLDAGAVALTGTVVDVNGGPIGHARVRALVDGTLDRPEWYPPVEADAAGTFTLWVKPGDIRVSAQADGYAPAHADTVAPGAVTVLLTPEASISGTVVDAKGALVADAIVSAEFVSVRASVRSDAAGAFRIESLVPGRYELRARIEHAFGEYPGSVSVGLAQHVTGVTIRVEPAARITGRVVTDRGEPCPGASVYLNDIYRSDDIRLTAIGDATFRLDAVRPGTYYAHPECPGYFAEVRYPPIIVTTADQDALMWAMRPGATLRGHVRDSRGALIVDADVLLRSSHRYESASSRSDGSYVIEGVAPGTYTLEAHTDRAGHVATELAITSVANVERDLVVEDGGTIIGFVRDTTGRPVSGVDVNASGDAHPGATRTRADGGYTLDLRAGMYDVYPSRGWGQDLADKRAVTIESGQTETLDFTVPAETGVIRGDVKDASGAPIGDAYVSAYRSSFGDDLFMWSFSDRPVLTAADGTFEIRELGPGTYNILAVRRGGGEIRHKGVETGSTVHVVMPVTGSLAGTVTYADGQLPDELYVTVRDSNREVFRDDHFLHTRGAFRMDGLPAGELHVAASSPDGLGVATFTLGVGEHREGAKVTLDRNVIIKGRVIHAQTKQPLADMFVVPKAPRAQRGIALDPDDISHKTDANGRFSVSSPTGRVSITIKAPGFRNPDTCSKDLERTLTAPVDLGDIEIDCERAP